VAYKKAKRDRKEEVIRLRVTTEQKEAMVEAAKKQGLDISAWLRFLGMTAAGTVEIQQRSRIQMPGRPRKP
jgi:uncharacterized protein (DUF1778 family)